MPEKTNKEPLGTLFRRKREEKGLLVRQVAAVTELDQAIISRIENNDRLPTREQLYKLAGLYNLDLKEILAYWLAEKMVRDYAHEPLAADALKEANEIILDRNISQVNQTEFNFFVEPPRKKPKKPRTGGEPGTDPASAKA